MHMNKIIIPFMFHKIATFNTSSSILSYLFFLSSNVYFIHILVHSFGQFFSLRYVGRDVPFDFEYEIRHVILKLHLF